MQMMVHLNHVTKTLQSNPTSTAYTTCAVFSPGRGLAGFPQEKLRWRIKSQEDAPVWAQRQATCQTDFRVGTLE